MKYSGGSPARQPLPEIAENQFSNSLIKETLETRDPVLPYLRLLWANRLLVYRVALYALLASALIAFLIPSRYESTTRLMPPDSQSSSGLAMAAATMANGTGGGLSALASDFLGLKSSSDIFVGILTSRTVQDDLIQRFELKKLYGARTMEDARRVLSTKTSIGVDRKSQIISITVTDHNPQRAAAIGESYVEELNRLVAELSTSSARRERIFLEERLSNVTKDLEKAERDFSQFASKNSAIDVKEQGKAMVEAAAALQGQLIAAEAQYQGLREIYTDNNTHTRAVKARIDELQRQLERLGGKGESTTAVDGEGAKDSLYPSIRKLPLLGVTWADLYRRAKIQEAVLETLTKEYEMAKVQEAKEIPTVKVLDLANIPDKKSFPPRLLMMFLGTVCAVVAMMIWIVGRETWRQADARDPRMLFAQQVVADVKTRLPGMSGYESLRGTAGRDSLRWNPHDPDDRDVKS
jgi:capsule polysaccharide export protein KpsE/RkpR